MAIDPDLYLTDSDRLADDYLATTPILAHALRFCQHYQPDLIAVVIIDDPRPNRPVPRESHRELVRVIGDRLHNGVLCPSAHTPRRNRHRSGDGWQASTVRAILENPRYTGYAFFGRWTKHEELLDRDDVAAGKVVRFRRSSNDRVIRSREPAHPAIISVETYTQVQLARRARGGGGLQRRAKLERTRVSGRQLYRIRCRDCDRKMEGGIKDNSVWYRCRASTLAPSSPALESHPRTVNLAESRLIVPVNNWIATVFDRRHRIGSGRCPSAISFDPAEPVWREFLEPRAGSRLGVCDNRSPTWGPVRRRRVLRDRRARLPAARQAYRPPISPSSPRSTDMRRPEILCFARYFGLFGVRGARANTQLDLRKR
ncbi:recombinase family protein [Nocardia sp. NPDC057030]|uniref:recombinase family protein n=1 Tax=unclassified Nocardia TaxID=2637762 RepID=UPI00362D64D2